MGDIIQFIPRPRHKRSTDFPTIPFKVPAEIWDVLHKATHEEPPKDRDPAA